jgi:hypothetical protein
MVPDPLVEDQMNNSGYIRTEYIKYRQLFTKLNANISSKIRNYDLFDLAIIKNDICSFARVGVFSMYVVSLVML